VTNSERAAKVEYHECPIAANVLAVGEWVQVKIGPS